MASEMLYPVMPIYLQSIGYSVIVIGIIEGVAEAMAGLSKGYFGNLSDATAKRVPFVRLGYALSAISKPMMALLTSAWWILSARIIDRLGKGVRTGARDALLSEQSTVADKGKVFGFHRSVDTVGAVLGPGLALFYLHLNPGHYRELFLIAFIPGVIAVAFTFLLKDKSLKPSIKSKPGFLDFVNYLKSGPAAYRKLVFPLFLFALVNSSDVFLLLKMKELGADDTEVIGFYIFYNLVYALAAFPLGILADKMGLKKMIVLGTFLFSAVYFAAAITNNYTIFLILFAVYGIYAAATEGVAKALITNVCPQKESATAIGTFTAFQSICLMLASIIAGWVWYSTGSEIVFLYAAIVSGVVAIWISNQKISENNFLSKE